MNILIVHAHPEPKSFTSSLKNTAKEKLEKQGHYEVRPRFVRNLSKVMLTS